MEIEFGGGLRGSLSGRALEGGPRDVRFVGGLRGGGP